MKEFSLNEHDKMLKEALPVRSWINEDPLSFYSIRQYAPSDSIKKINWNKTAQLSRLMVNEYENNINKNINIFVNVDAYYNNLYNADAVEDLLRYAVYIVRYFIKNNYTVGIIINCATVIKGHECICLYPDTGIKHMIRIYDLISMADIRAIIDSELIIKQNKKRLAGCSNIILSCGNEAGNDILNIFKSYKIDAKLIIANKQINK